MNSTRQLSHDWFPRPLPDNVELGEGSWLYSSFAFLHYQSRRACGVRIGRNSGVYNGTFFDLNVDGEVIIGDYSTLVGAIIATNARVSIADYVFIAHEVTIADDFAAIPRRATIDVRYDRHNIPEKEGCSEISIGQGAWIGSRAVILPGARIGEGAIVGAACVVDMEVPPYATVAGNPGRIHLSSNRR
jgi:acetyltransferase-like isoleucine patch superfamily enzyme